MITLLLADAGQGRVPVGGVRAAAAGGAGLLPWTLGAVPEARQGPAGQWTRRSRAAERRRRRP